MTQNDICTLCEISGILYGLSINNQLEKELIGILREQANIITDMVSRYSGIIDMAIQYSGSKSENDRY